jgi:Zn-dependent M16 (insulinase) family peptidase
LYGDLGGKDLPTAFNDLEDYKILDQWTDADWRGLLDKYYVSQPSITTVGKPSAALSAKIEQEEKDRIAQRKKEMGEDKLRQLEKDLEDAKKESDRPPPDDMIASFPITDVSSIVISLTISQRL